MIQDPFQTPKNYNNSNESNAFARPQTLLSRQEPPQQQLSHPPTILSLNPSPSFNSRQILQYPPPSSSSASPSLTSLVVALPHSPPPQQQPLLSFEEIQEAFKRVIDFAKRDEMFDAFNLLSSITSNVVTNCERFGLTSDESFSIDREGFWKKLNDCWLYAISQVNKNYSKHHQQQSQSLPSQEQQQQPPQRIGKEYLYKLRESVVSWADVLERYGLVDYEMGYWEQAFLDAIDSQINLLSLHNISDDIHNNTPTRHTSSTHNDSNVFHRQQQQQRVSNTTAMDVKFHGNTGFASSS
ncbi:12197_t:CDS:2 [Ambispora gerdemannii]|uniref:12197_t:CDS:1 n=1 Tax=Ambispora gerdemannii TaxID=144530 RepID=A0A9N9F2H8_9GLOM|nr:12197_t:CDS:2 [Ambispora gerdemannii]